MDSPSKTTTLPSVCCSEPDLKALLHTDITAALLMPWFDYGELPKDLQAVSAPFHVLATELFNSLQPSVYRTEALRKLLQSKNAAVRAAL